MQTIDIAVPPLVLSQVLCLRDEQKEFFADNLGKEFTGIIADAFADKDFRQNHGTV